MVRLLELYAANLLLYEINPTSQTGFSSGRKFNNFADFINHYQRKRMKESIFYCVLHSSQKRWKKTPLETTEKKSFVTRVDKLSKWNSREHDKRRDGANCT